MTRDPQALEPQALDALARALGLGERAAPILDPLRRLYDDLDAELRSRAAGLELPCRAGCDACCHESVFVSAPEVLAVFAHLLATRTPAELAALVAAMRALAARFEDELELLESIAPGPERDEVAARVRFRCPLLGEGGACTIYPARELNARTFGQSWDPSRGEAYGCELTQARLRVLPPESGLQLVGARAARARLAALFPDSGVVHVYPWWFARYGDALLAVSAPEQDTSSSNNEGQTREEREGA